jgi:RNA polymerase sigma-70 factor (ECF subfamily)
MDAADPATLSQLLDEHGASLVLYAQQWCHAPEDAVQLAFIRLMRQRPAPKNFVGWLYRVVRNEAVSQARTTNRRTRYEAAAQSQREPWFQATCGDALDAASASAALELLPIEYREPVVLRIWSGMSFEQIAELIGTSSSTAHRRYEHGLRLLRENWSISCRNE